MKRKRTNEGKSGKRTNPFLKLQADAFPNKVKAREDVLSLVLAFSEASRQNHTERERSNELNETVTSLLEYLSRYDAHDNSSADSLLSPADVATMLLQWAVKNLLHRSTQEKSVENPSASISLYWKTLRSSLSVLLSRKGDVSADINTCLSQSTLNKLVPLCARTAFTGNTENDVAVCYTLLVDHLYRPTMDSACHSLLPLMDEPVYQRATTMVECRLLLPTMDHVRMLESTVQLLKRLQSTSNPKKVFQLLAEPKVLSALSRWRLADAGVIQTSVRELLCEALFSPFYHIEGFRSMNLTVPVMTEPGDTLTKKKAEKSKAFHCYQKTLLDTIALLIKTSERKEQTNGDANAAALLVPELLTGLIDMFAGWGRDSAAMLRKNGGRDMAPVQFRLWCNLIFPIVMELRKLGLKPLEHERRRQLSSGSAVVLLRSLRETLSLVLQHKLYLPSHKDELNLSFSFLKALATTFLDTLDTVKHVGESDLATQVTSECLQGLETLFCLNHLVAHERLHLLIAACGIVSSSSHRKEVARVKAHQRDLFLAIMRTYHRLRQLDHLFQSLLKATETLRDDCALFSLKELLKENRVNEEFASAVLKCPPSQIKDLFGILNLWIQHGTGALGGDMPSMEDIAFAVSLFVLLIRYVRVNNHTSADVFALCEEAIKKTVYALMNGPHGGGSSKHALKKEAIVLTGWLVDLRNRCTFWYDRSDEANSESNLDVIPEILEELGLVFAKNSTDEDVMTESIACGYNGSMLDEIQFLLIHRIRELHTAIYEEQHAGLTDQEGSLRMSSLVGEAHRLVNTAISIAQNDNASVAGWKLLAKTVSYWAPYSEPKHAEAFLSWMFSTLSSPETLSSTENDGLTSQAIESEEKSIEKGKAIAESLLHDASFFEITELATQFHPVGLSCAVGLLNCAMAKESNDPNALEAPVVFNGLELTSYSNDYSIEQLSETMATLTLTKIKTFSRGGIVRPRWLQQATRIIRLLNGAPLAHDGKNHSLLIQLDVLCCLLCLKSNLACVEMDLLPLICASRTYLASFLDHHPDIINDQGLALLTKGFIQSTTEVMKHISSLDDMTQVEFLRASQRVVESIAGSCLSVFQQYTEPSTALIGCFRDLMMDDRDIDDAERCVLMTFSRSLAKRLLVYFQSNSLAKQNDSIHGIIYPFIISTRQAFGASDAFCSKSEYVQAEKILLDGDLARLASQLMTIPTETLDMSVVEKFLESRNTAVRRAAEYYLACTVASGHAPHSTAELIIDICLAGSNQLLDATFCGLVCAMEANDMRGLLGRLTREAHAPTDGKLHALHLFLLILEHVRIEGALMEVSQYARAFFTLSVELLCPFDGTDLSSWVGGCNLGASLLIALTDNKDIMVIRERDLGLILAQVVSAMGGGSFWKPNVAPVDGGVYSLCFLLVSTLLQRFPKQLYACVPSVISTIHVLLKHAIYGALSDEEIMRRAQVFTRLCELLIPHREVYKKHVLVLILEFIAALRIGIHPSRSKGIQPAVYCLIDMLSQYETEQLNTIMDTTSKALFRSVYQNYQKTHFYKGQY